MFAVFVDLKTGRNSKGPKGLSRCFVSLRFIELTFKEKDGRIVGINLQVSVCQPIQIWILVYGRV